MVTLYQLAQQTEPDDRIRWVGEKTDVNDPEPRTVTRVILEAGRVTVEADGPQGGQAKFWVEENGDSEALFGENEQPMGAVEWAELVDKDVFFSQ